MTEVVVGREYRLKPCLYARHGSGGAITGIVKSRPNPEGLVRFSVTNSGTIVVLGAVAARAGNVFYVYPKDLEDTPP